MRNWKIESLGNIADIRVSNVDKKSNPGEVPVRLCNYMDVYAHNYISDDVTFMEATATSAEIQKFRVFRGDVLITKDSETPDDIGIPAVVINDIPDLVCGYHLALLKPKRDQVDPRYLAKQLGASRTAAYFSRLANGSTRYGLSYGSIAFAPIPLAPLAQQRRIAEILATLDEAIEQTEAYIVKTQQIKAGLMHELLTRGVTADWRLRPTRKEGPQLYKESPVGWIPTEWEVVSFGECILGTPQNGLYKPAEDYGDTGTPIVRIDGFYDGVMAPIQDLKRVRLTLTESEIYSLSPGDILINRVNSIDYVGKSALVPGSEEQVVFESNIMRCPMNRARIQPEFAIRWLCSPAVAAYFHSRAKSAIAQASINQTDVISLPTILPDPEEQRRICSRVASLDSSLDHEKQQLQKLRHLKFGLGYDLLDAGVPVPVPEAEEEGSNG